MVVYCKHCGKNLGDFGLKDFAQCVKGYAKSGRRVVFCSNDCYEQYKLQFKVEDYKDSTIYRIDVNGEERYMPYWFSQYYFLTVEDCRKRIDMKSVSVVNENMLRGFFKQF